MNTKFRKYLLEAKPKIKYTYSEDGIFSNIFSSPYGEYSNFKSAKKELVKNTKVRMQNFKSGLKSLHKKASDVDGEGKYFDVYFDGMYTQITRSTVEFDEIKNFAAAKKMARDYFRERIREWSTAWKDAVAKKESDVEED